MLKTLWMMLLKESFKVCQVFFLHSIQALRQFVCLQSATKNCPWSTIQWPNNMSLKSTFSGKRPRIFFRIREGLESRRVFCKTNIRSWRDVRFNSNYRKVWVIEVVNQTFFVFILFRTFRGRNQGERLWRWRFRGWRIKRCESVVGRSTKKIQKTQTKII